MRHVAPSWLTHHAVAVDQRQQGMTLVEMILAMLMLVAFGAVLVTATAFISRFMAQALRSVDTNKPTGALIDQHQLQMAMDQIADTLAQPGFSKDDLKAIHGDPQKACAYNPWQAVEFGGWGLPGRRMPSRADYRFCLRSTSLSEPQLDSMPTEKPGIYVIQALPDQLSASALPARRIFCRPKPFCSP